MLCEQDRKTLKRFYETKYHRVKDINVMIRSYRLLSKSENKERAAFSKEALKIFLEKKREVQSERCKARGVK